MPSAQDVYITPASSVIDVYTGSTKVGYVSGTSTSKMVVSGATHLKIAASDDLELFSGNDKMDFNVGGTTRLELTGSVFRGGGFSGFGVGTWNPVGKFNVSGGASTFDNGGSTSVFFKNAGSQYGAIDAYGTSLSIEANNEAILSGTSGVLLKGGNYGVLLPPLGTSAGDTSRLRFRELAANGTATVSIKAPDSISSDIQMILPDAAGTANQVLAVDSVSSGIMTLGFQNSGGSPGGSNTQLQYNNGGSFGGIDDLVWDGNKLLLGDSSDTGNYLLVEGSDSDNTYTVFEGKRKYPRIRLTDTAPSTDKTFDIWNLGSQLRFGSNAGSSTVAAMFVQHGTPAEGLTYGSVTMNSGVMIGTSNPINSSRVSIVDTQRPLTVAYDGTNYASFEVSSGGVLTVATNMANAGLTDRFLFDGNHFRGTDTNAPSMRNETPSATNPVFTFNNDVDTGMSRAAADELSLITAGTEAIRVDSSQKVFIGGGSTSDSLLELREYSSGRGQICFYPPGGTSKNRIYATTEASPNMVMHADASIELDADENIDFDAGGSTRMYITSAGKVGIGTTAPTAKFEVTSPTNSYEQARFQWDTSNYLGVFVDSAGNSQLEAKTGNLTLKTDTSAHDVRVDAKGNFRVDLGDSNGGYYTRIRAADSSPVFIAKSNGLIGMGTESPAAGVHISSTETSQLRITSGSNTQCDFKVSQYGGLVLDVNHTLEFDVTRHMDYKVGSSRLHRFHVGGTQTLQHQLESGGGLLDFKGTQGKIWHAATPVAQIKDDVGIIMEDNQGIRNHVQTLATWALDAATGNGQTTIQGFSKIQNINTAGIPAPELGAFSALQVVLPSATAGDEFIVVFGSSQSNLTGKNVVLKANGSETINSGSSTGNVTYSKNTGESIHVVCYETGKWTVVSHV